MQAPRRNRDLSALVTRHALRGLTASEIASQTHLTPRRIHQITQALSLPKNKTIRPHSTLEARILRAYVACNGDLTIVSAAFRQAPSRLKSLLRRIRNESRRPHV